MPEIKCKLCSCKSEFIDKYKFNVESDVEYFGKLDIYYCEKCDFGFTNPDPTQKNLDYFYKHIYRSKGRPHEINYDLDTSLYHQKNYNYVEYLCTFVDFNNIKNVFDFGSGTGELVCLLKKRYKHLKIFTIENDDYSKRILKDRDVQVFRDFDEINIKFDLIISTHVLEHLINLEVLNSFKKISNEKCKYFFEVPNNQFKKNFMARPYDSPHTLFFSKKSLYTIKNLFDFNLINLSFYSTSLDDHYNNMRISKQKYEKILNDRKFIFIQILKQRIKNMLKIFIPKKLIQMRNAHIQVENAAKYPNNENSWCVRVIFQNN